MFRQQTPAPRGAWPLVLIWCAVCLLSAPGFGWAQPPGPQKLISIEAKARPLGEVLNQISRESGYVFQIEDSWRSHRVTVSLVNAPLDFGLKRVLSGLNHAIVYLPGPVVKIVVIADAPPGQATTAPGAPRPSLRKPIDRGPQPPQPAPPAPSPAEESDDSDDDSPPAEGQTPPPPRN